MAEQVQRCRAAAVYADDVRRYVWRPDQEGQALLLRGLPGHTLSQGWNAGRFGDSYGLPAWQLLRAAGAAYALCAGSGAGGLPEQPGSGDESGGDVSGESSRAVSGPEPYPDRRDCAEQLRRDFP